MIRVILGQKCQLHGSPGYGVKKRPLTIIAIEGRNLVLFQEGFWSLGFLSRLAPLIEMTPYAPLGGKLEQFEPTPRCCFVEEAMFVLEMGMIISWVLIATKERGTVENA
ncbi:MAG: hypothetical protein HQK55_19595 [Deltaproteobacteria bacterium]|nr:hypothetical protein [Deltaproteobacteria bacterium]